MDTMDTPTTADRGTGRFPAALALGALLCVGLVGLGAVGGRVVGEAARSVRLLDRTVTVKGLAEREVPADTVVWPIVFLASDDDLGALYAGIETTRAEIAAFLESRDVMPADVSFGTPAVNDVRAYGGSVEPGTPRYSARTTVTVYSNDVDTVRAAIGDVLELGKRGIALTGDEYANATRYLFDGLNELKPAMIEEATRNAREVADRFAADSDSTLGKIRTARQGQFTIEDRDAGTPHVKRVRVVSTIEYYLSD